MVNSKASYDFGGKVVVVTGASQGIGLEILTQFNNFGASGVNWDLSVESAGKTSQTVDVTDPLSVQTALDNTIKAHGRIDILVNSAGYAGQTASVEESDPALWEKIVKVNLFGTYNVCRAVAPIMRNDGYGRIANIASLAGKEGTPNSSAYSAAKAGVIALTKSLGKELAQAGVLVNAIAPAAVKTKLLEQWSQEHVQTMIDKSPMKRLGEPSEVAEMILWMCSDSCTFSTGFAFDLSGGRATY